MQALRVVKSGQVELRDDVPRPEPGPGEVLVRVAAAGMCGTDLEMREAPPSLGTHVPFTLGHEVAGHVESLGDGVTDVPVGRLVAVYPLNGCGQCVTCAKGEDNLCRTRHVSSIGMDRNGGLADYLVIPARSAFDATGIEPMQAATCTDAGLTSYRAVALGLKLQTDPRVIAVIGIGGLGHVAVQIVKATSDATVIAVDTDESKLELAHKLGADHTVVAGDDAAQQIMDLAGGRQVDLAFDFVAAQPTLDLAAAVTGNGGSIVIPGMGGGNLTFTAAFGGPLANEISAMRTVNGARQDLAEVLDLTRQGKLHTQITAFPIDQAVHALDLLAHGKITGRAVVHLDQG